MLIRIPVSGSDGSSLCRSVCVVLLNGSHPVMKCLVLFLFYFGAMTQAQFNPLKDPNICGRPTCAGNGKFRYGPGTKQNYKYTVDISSVFNGTSQNASTMHIEADVSLTFVTGCYGILSVRNVVLRDNPNLPFGEELAYRTLRFSFNDGAITEVCPDVDESTWVLNFKKGLLSMLHNTMRRFDLDHATDEEDVYGKCRTQYKVLGAKHTSLLIEKTKDLDTCMDRHRIDSFVKMRSYNLGTKQDESTMLKSSSRCELSVDHYIYNEIRCEERYVFEPFSNQDAGATTVVKRRLGLVDEEEEIVDEQGPIYRRTPLFFDYVPTPKPTSGELNVSKELVRKLCTLSLDKIQTDFSDLFTKFIHNSRTLSHSTLSVLYEESPTICSSGRKHILDALPYVSSAASLTLMKDLILKNAIPEDIVDEWLLSISFISHPDDAMMKAASELIAKKPTDTAAVLSISALTRSFCENHDGCVSNEHVVKVLHVLQNVTKVAYEKDKVDSKRLIVSLKALSNIGVSTEDFGVTLREIVLDRRLEPQVRVAAVEAHRRFRCEESRGFFEKVLRDVDEEVEVRIAAYLQVMRCPNYVVIRSIKHCLEVEEVNQVGSFMWSHLSNILESSVPSRVEIQGLLSDKDLGKKFNSDVRKFSQNFEKSVFFEEYNMGGNVESNVIFSPSSYIPKSGMVNLTVDLFGESINLLEVYGRMEGFEHYLESMFGPEGSFDTAKLKEKIPRLRWDRSVSENEVLKSEINSLPNVLGNRKEEPKVSLGLKVFGNELKYVSLEGSEEIKGALYRLNPLDYIQQILSGREIGYNKAAMFLDSSYVVSTGAGMPLTLNAVGTASINLKLYGSLQMADFSKNKELELVGNIHPNVALDVIGTMSVDGYYLNTGIKLKTNMYTSTSLEGNVRIKGSKLVSVKFGIPRETTEIFGVKSELIVMKKDTEERQAGVKDRQVSQSICSWPSVEQTIGLKICADYHYTNVSTSKTSPFFFLAGPAGFRLSLQKSDPTAKIYLMEYRWTKENNSSVISLTFDTPGSNLRRLLAANLTLNTETKNITLLLESSAGRVLAKGRYKNSVDEKYLQVSLDINGKKHLDASCSLQQKEIRHGITYLPRAHLNVNDERVLELYGTVKTVSKKGITQFDVDLKFQTKRLTSKLFGYISRTGASVAANLKLDYKFANTKEQRAVFDFSLANRSTPNIFVIKGDCRLSSTAYPNFSFDAALKIQRGGGHTECKFELNSNPLPATHPDAEYHRLNFQALFSYKVRDSKRLNAVASLTRASTDLDLRLQFSYDHNEPDTNAILIVRYAKNKDVAVSVFWSHPRSSLEHFEGRLNVTVPGFDVPMVVEIKLHEKQTADYIVELKASWFSGHTISARGIYQDKSTSRAASYHLKFLLKSPSFREINVDCQFYRNNNLLKIDTKADQNGDEYSLFLKHSTNSPYEIITEGKLKYKTKQYSITSVLHLKDQRKIIIELHLDQIRDIHLATWGYSTGGQKAAGLELKWDANRDPNQKLAFTLDYANPGSYNHVGSFVLSYPGRTINGLFDFLLQGEHFSTSTRLSWSTEDSLVMRIKADYKRSPETLFIVQSEVITPFDGWKRTAFGGGFRHKDNMYSVNGSLNWQRDQHVSLELFADHTSGSDAFTCEFSGALRSTVLDIPSLSATLKHRHNATKTDSSVRMTYYPEQVISIKSIWQIDEDLESTNLTGTVTLTSPFKGFKRGLLISKIYTLNKRYIRGVADLDLDHKKFTTSIEGFFQKITRNMLVVNITTPIEKYNSITGRFGVSDEKKHIVAMVLYPSNSLGIDILFNINTITDFDTKFSLATPVEFLQKVLVVGKLKPEEADFRAGWNTLLGGFSGVWHYVNITDFNYSYKIYTPIEGFEENGLVVRLIFKEDLDAELSGKLAQHKLGFAIVGKSKPKILKELGIKPIPIPADEDYGDTYEEYDDEEYDDPISWTGFVEIDALVYPTMKGTLDVDRQGTLYVIVGKLTLPDGIAEFRDELDMVDVFKMKNTFHLNTPYKSCKVVTSNYNLKIMPGYQYLLNVDVNYQNGSSWIETGAFAHYVSEAGEDDYDRLNVTLHVHTPFETLPRLDVHGLLQTGENIYKGNFSIRTNSSNISAAAKAKVVGKFVGTDLDMSVATPLITVPPLKLYFMKNFTDAASEARLNFVVTQNNVKNYQLESGFRYVSLKNWRGQFELTTPFRGMEFSKAAAVLFITDRTAEATATLFLYPLDVTVNATTGDSHFRTAANIILNKKRHDISLTCKIFGTSPDRRQLSGVLNVREKTFAISGSADMSNGIPVSANIRLEDESGSEPLNFNYQLHPQAAGYALRASVRHSQKFANFEAHITGEHKFDWELDLRVETSFSEFSKFGLHTRAMLEGDNKTLVVDARTPLERVGNPRLTASLVKLGAENLAELNYDVAGTRGEVEAAFAWVLLENMRVKVAGKTRGANFSKEASAEVYYINPAKSFKNLALGGNVDINKMWTTLLNLTLRLPERQHIYVAGHAKLPPPNSETHHILARLIGNRNMDVIEYILEYRTLLSTLKYGSSGKVTYQNYDYMNGLVDVEWNGKHVNNYIELRKPYRAMELVYKLRTPKFSDQETFVANLNYTYSDTHRNITCEAFYPGRRSVGSARVDFKEFENMNGTVNVTTPFKGFNYTGAEFRTETNAFVYNRYLKLLWPNNTALFDSKCTTTMSSKSVLERATKGFVVVEVPLATRHTANVDYVYNEELGRSTGQAMVEYNRKKVLEGKYNCLSESRAGFDKDTIHVELENKWLPIGADYVHGFEYSAPRDGSNKPTVDYKMLNLYRLQNVTKFNVTGEITVTSTLTGQEISLTAIHSNRTVKFLTDYDVLEQRFKQHSRIELAPAAWLEYDLDLLNNTVDEFSDAQQIQMNVSYPRRNFTAFASYNVSSDSVYSDASLVWDNHQKTVKSSLDWRRLRPSHQIFEVKIMHPSFEKDVSLLGEYEGSGGRYANASLVVDYSKNPERTMRVRGVIEDDSDAAMRKYAYGIWATHSATNLDLNARGGVYWKPRWYHTKHITDYKRSYLPLQSSEASGRLDCDQNEIELKRKTLGALTYFWGRYRGSFPVYTANISAIHGKDINASGEFYFNFREKLLQLELNKTTDGSQSLHMYGVIPDARSAFFDIWRDYEEIRISDVSYLLRLNHSRLVVSNLIWRPELKEDIKNGIRAASVDLYNDIMEGTEYWKQYIRSETVDAVKDVWEDAEPSLKKFLDDLKDLKLLEEDIEELKTFLNNSYHANEFYVKDIVGFVVFAFDELSIKSHLESLPAIVNEIWEVMGDTGRKIQKSILWIIEKIKSYYKNAAEFINGLVQGNSVEHLSEALKKLVEKYDNFIKELHVSFIRYMEELWNQSYALMVQNWHRTLAAIEPTFLRIIHYLETMIWNTSKEFLDFLYIRKNEIIEHPYFSKFSNFTHDLDVFYKDMTGNDTIASVYKYTKVVWNFLKEKYFKLVPFGKELQDVVSEIVGELAELKKLSSVQYVLEKYNKVYNKAQSMWEYFDMENRLHRFITLIHRKLTDMTQTALQAENRYREAKTKFIFEPTEGVMYLEQKLPMSWHAFNETPKFQEIPEVKVFYDAQSYFTLSRLSFWDYYYEYKPYTNPDDWFPPFKASAMLISGRHLVTFDGTYYTLKDGCGSSYLLGRDFVDGNFTVVLSRTKSRPELILLVNGTTVRIDVSAGTVKVGDGGSARLPFQIGNAFLYQNAETVYVESSLGFALRCDAKYDVCMFEVSGWYFGKTAGLWGTMNNEPSDDLLTSDRQKAKLSDIESFVDSWSVDRRRKCSVGLETAPSRTPSDDVRTLCEAIFASKVSPFVTCFSRVLSEPFLSMCLDSTSEKEACTTVAAYTYLCALENTPLTIPETCIKCNLLNGSQVTEGRVVRLEGDTVPQSADVVFIVEAKDCNDGLRSKNKIDALMEAVNTEFAAANLTDNRYSVVVFGGDGIFDNPRSVASNNEIFLDHKSVLSHFDKIPTGNGSSDIFQALAFATNLIFRPGVSKTFILLPCSRCKDSDMKFDYAILHQLLLENDVTLHILMNEDFQPHKARSNRIFFGVDRSRAYTKKDSQDLKGDTNLRKEVRLPKSRLGFCTPLALETNGSIFSALRLSADKMQAAKKFATVFAKRLAQTAVPGKCKICECTAPRGVPYMECFPCHYPTRGAIDLGFNEDEALAVMQPSGEEFFNYSE